MIWIKILRNIIKTLHSNENPYQIAFGISLGLLIGFSPLASPQTFLFLLLVFILNVNMGMAFLTAPLFKIVSLLVSRFSHLIGSYLLVDISYLKKFWTTLYNTPIVPFTKFNNTVVLGSFIIALILFIPITVLAKKLVVYYRENVMNHIEKYKIIRILTASRFYAAYVKIRDFGFGG